MKHYTNLYLYRPENAKELFNLRHASLRNAIERIFGVCKRKFKILGSVGEFSIDTQVHLVLGLVGLYNFIRSKEGIQDESIEEAQTQDEASDVEPVSHTISSKAMEKKRDKLAQDMWTDYCIYIGRDH